MLPDNYNEEKKMRSNTYKLTRKNPVTGFIETCHYTGSLKNAPAGWYWSGLPKDKTKG